MVSAMALNSRPSQAMVSPPVSGTRRSRSPAAISRAVVSKRCSRRSTATRTTPPIATTSSSASPALPAAIQRRSRLSELRIWPASTSTIRMPLMRWLGSWQPKQAWRFGTGITVRSSVSFAVSITRLPVRCSGG